MRTRKNVKRGSAKFRKQRKEILVYRRKFVLRMKKGGKSLAHLKEKKKKEMRRKSEKNKKEG